MSRSGQLRRASQTYYAKNRDKILAKKKQDRKNNPDRLKNWRLKGRYGITLEEWQALYDEQGGRCAICDRHASELKRTLVVDHDHQTGKVRGLLCHDCNAALGLMGDDPDRLKRACKYLLVS
jgi:hypothetical protein